MRLLFLAVILFSTIVAEAADCPKISLDWGSYQGTPDPRQPSICFYENVRFASPPTGQLRFKAPKYPPSKSDPPAPDGPVACIKPTNLACPKNGPGGGPVPAGGCDRDKCLNISRATNFREDCLFLDVYVPLSSFKSQGSTKLPVVVWFYGGGFITGSKRPLKDSTFDLYPGTDILTSVKEPAIFVAGNYRLGAYGWLAGTYMEKNGQPNAGLHDQRAILTFVQDHISKFQGDKSRVSVWGESAGASSILHHITMPANIKTPLFKNAVLQSPAYQWLWNRTGALNETFTSFAKLVAKGAGCKTANMDCLRNASDQVLLTANNELLSEASCDGILPVGPSVDGCAIPDLTPNLLKAGKYTRQLTSIVISHTATEIPKSHNATDISFIPAPIRQDPYNEAPFNQFLSAYFNSVDIENAIKKQYPANRFDGDQSARAARMIMDSSFVCNGHNLFDAFGGSKTAVYSMNYRFGNLLGFARHASDIIPSFAQSDGNYANFIVCLACDNPLVRPIAPYLNTIFTQRLGLGMKSYFMSAALHDDPNKLAAGEAAEKPWLQATNVSCDSSMCIGNTMTPDYFLGIGNVFMFNTQTDQQMSAATCDFWTGITRQLKVKVQREKGEQVEQADLDELDRLDKLAGAERPLVTDDADLGLSFDVDRGQAEHDLQKPIVLEL